MAWSGLQVQFCLQLSTGASKTQSGQRLTDQLSDKGAQDEASQEACGADEIGSQGETNIVRGGGEENGQDGYDQEDAHGKGAGVATALLGERSEAFLPGLGFGWSELGNHD